WSSGNSTRHPPAMPTPPVANEPAQTRLELRLQPLRLQIRKIIEPELSPTVITSLTGRTSLFSTLSVAGI
ncbi:MAG: hypothetical protein BRC54_06085, partial [Cyanobacteria bacterium SW_7_48_12]